MHVICDATFRVSLLSYNKQQYKITDQRKNDFLFDM